ncbi:CYTH domain-containing protein [Lysinibacillus sp. PLM2]|nr:CYTH domain-containing protein [Lysinibacillus sp. PLM2]
MTQEIEIEFKNLLTKEQYEMLLKEFDINDSKIIRQTNHYFDTPDWHLKTLHAGLRIRETKSSIVCTLKEKTAKNTHLETTEPLTSKEAEMMLCGQRFYAPSIQRKLLNLNVPVDELRVFGSLTTDRVELPYKGGILVLDHSFYLNCDDYEVEYEADDENTGAKVFNKFLTDFQIEKRVTDKKIARFMKALNAKKG